MNSSCQTESGSIARSFPAVPASVPLARQAVVELALRAGAGDEEIDAIRLAISEALTNAVLHAYEGAPGLVHIEAATCEQGLEVTIADDGAGMRPRVDTRGMGIGLALIAEATEELAITKRVEGGTALEMVFALSPRT